MMKRTTLLLALILLCGAIFSTQAEEVDYESIYADILTSCADLLENGSDKHITTEGEIGIRELRSSTDSEDASWQVGYAIQDLSGDGIPELVIAHVDRQEEMLSYGTAIYAVYTCQDGIPSLTFHGWSRNYYCMMHDGSFYNQGSSGAMYSCFGLYQLSPDGTELNCLDFFFTNEKDENFTTIGYYHNTDGVWDASYEGTDELLEDEFWQLNNVLCAEPQPIELTSFALYEKPETSSCVKAYWFQDVSVMEYEEVSIGNADTEGQVLLSAFGGSVTDLELLSLELKDVDEQGNTSFTTDPLWHFDTLEPGHPLAVDASMFGAIPNFGIRYTDDSGVTKTFALSVSGRDGSLLMTEIG